MIVWIEAHTINADEEPVEYGAHVTLTPISDPVADDLTDTEFAFMRKQETIRMEHEVLDLQKLALNSLSGLNHSYLTFTFVNDTELTDENISDSPELTVRWIGYNRFWDHDPNTTYNLTDMIKGMIDFADQH